MAGFITSRSKAEQQWSQLRDSYTDLLKDMDMQVGEVERDQQKFYQVLAGPVPDRDRGKEILPDNPAARSASLVQGCRRPMTSGTLRADQELQAAVHERTTPDRLFSKSCQRFGCRTGG